MSDTVQRERGETIRIAFTMPRIEAIKPPSPEGGNDHAREWHYDDKQPGLALMVTSAGTKTFYLIKRVQGRPQRIRLGRFPEMNVIQARTEAARLLGEIAMDRDPQEAIRKARRTAAQVPTFQSAWDHYRDNHLKIYCTPKTVQNDGYFFNCVPWKDRRLDTVDADNAKSLHLRLTKERGATMANRVIQLLQRLYNYAIDAMGYQKANPVRAKHGRRSQHRSMALTVPLNKEKSRERYLLPEELPRFFTTLRDYEDEDFRDLVLLLLFTGVRRNNVQAMQWDEIGLEQALWTIPRTKNGDEVKVPLSRWALEVLGRRAEKRTGSLPWVFPGAKSASGHIEEPKKHWWEFMKRAEIAGLHMHDLRRTLATYQRSGGATLEIIGPSLGHRSRAATEIYARVDMAPVLQSITKATTAIMAAAEKKPVKTAETCAENDESKAIKVARKTG